MHSYPYVFRLIDPSSGYIHDTFLASKQHVYLISILDNLFQRLAGYGIRLQHLHSNQEFRSQPLADWCYRNNVSQSFSAEARPTANSIVERSFGTTERTILDNLLTERHTS